MPALLLLFVGSGCAALIYEIVWFQLLQLVIGSSAISLGVLLGTFMGGMCLGSLFLPRFVGTEQHPLKVYAYLELGIAAFGLLILFGMPLFGSAYSAIGTTGITGLVLRGVAAAICLLPPTLLMGATLPAIARWVKSTPEGMSWLGFFYGSNIAGGVLGCLLAGFYLMRVHDMAISTDVAVALNILVAGIALVLAGRTDYERAPEETGKIVATGRVGHLRRDRPLGPDGARIRSAVDPNAVAAFGATTYTFSLILAVFLFGLGIGSSVGSAIAGRTNRPRLALGWVSCCSAPRWRGRLTC